MVTAPPQSRLWRFDRNRLLHLAGDVSCVDTPCFQCTLHHCRRHQAANKLLPSVLAAGACKCHCANEQVCALTATLSNCREARCTDQIAITTHFHAHADTATGRLLVLFLHVCTPPESASGTLDQATAGDVHQHFMLTPQNAAHHRAAAASVCTCFLCLTLRTPAHRPSLTHTIIVIPPPCRLTSKPYS